MVDVVSPLDFPAFSGTSLLGKEKLNQEEGLKEQIAALDLYTDSLSRYRESLVFRLVQIEKEKRQKREPEENSPKERERGGEEEEEEEEEGRRENLSPFSSFDRTDAMLPRVWEILLRDMKESRSLSVPVVDFSDPSLLLQSFEDASCPISLRGERGEREKREERKEGSALERVIENVRMVLKNSVKTFHPYFFNQLYARVDPVGLVGNVLLDFLNTNACTYEVAPVITMVEREVIQSFGLLVGFNQDDIDGLFVPGGSISNLYAVHLARYHVCPPVRNNGLSQIFLEDVIQEKEGQKEEKVTSSPVKLVAFASSESHYSLKKSMMVCGLGLESVYPVPTTPISRIVSPSQFGSDCEGDTGGSGSGKMCPKQLSILLKKAIQEGKVPFLVMATAGTTVRGAFDNIEEIANVLDEIFPPSSPLPRPWLHVDGCWGGPVAFSKNRGLLNHIKGINRADSVAFDPHKQLGAPLPCSAFVNRHQGLLMRANATHADYLFQKKKNNANCDIGDLTIQCGRRGDALKMWLMWKAYGHDGLSQKIDGAFGVTRYFVSRLSTSEQLLNTTQTTQSSFSGKFVLADYTGYLNVCFWYIPPSLLSSQKEREALVEMLVKSRSGEREEERGEKERELFAKVGDVAPKLKDRMQRKGVAMIGFQPVAQFPVCFRIVFVVPTTTKREIDLLMERLDDLGKDL